MADPAPGAVLLDVRLDTADGAIAGRIALPARPLRLAELAAGVLPLIDRLVGLAARREQSSGRAISCRSGCAACCRHLVPVSAPEAWLLDDLLTGAPPERRVALALRFADTEGRLRQAGLRARLEHPDADEAGDLSTRYFALALPCPYLENEACSIYAQRPSACREYLVTSPAQHCWQPLTSGVARVGVSMRASQALAQLAAELYGGEPELIALPLAPAWAERNREAGRRAWEGRALLTRLLDLLGRE